MTHYKNNLVAGKEIIAIIRETKSKVEYKGFLKGNIEKYFYRAGKKIYKDNCRIKSEIADYKKIIAYSKYILEELNEELILKKSILKRALDGK